MYINLPTWTDSSLKLWLYAEYTFIYWSLLPLCWNISQMHAIHIPVLLICRFIVLNPNKDNLFLWGEIIDKILDNYDNVMIGDEMCLTSENTDSWAHLACCSLGKQETSWRIDEGAGVNGNANLQCSTQGCRSLFTCSIYFYACFSSFHILPNYYWFSIFAAL